jgi:hypothetical protein
MNAKHGEGMLRGANDVDPAWLMKLRVAVARCGEMDLGKWWNTNGQLGPYGGKALKRGFPRTHHFAQARSVFAVAAHRGAQVYDPPGSVTLWRLTDAIEDAFDISWESWLDEAESWESFFGQVAQTQSPAVDKLLGDLGLVTDDDIAVACRLKKSAEGKAVEILGPFSDARQLTSLLALGFMHGEPGSLAVPYARIVGQ